MLIHETAVISSQAKIDPSVKIGPYSVIGDHVTIGKDTAVSSHVVIEGHTTIGERNRICAGSVIGTEPQDKTYDDKESFIVIGNDNVFREYVTIHRGHREGSTTRVGNSNYLMASAHMGHDAVVGNHVVLANGTMLGGHVEVEDYAFISGLCGVHQYVRVGQYAMVGGLSRVTKDVVPFSLCEGNPLAVCGMNSVALKRASFNGQQISGIKEAFRTLFFSKVIFKDALEKLKPLAEKCKEVSHLIGFIQSSKRGIHGRSGSEKVNV